MPNTARWLAWLAMLKQSDAALVQLATMAAASVLIWEQMRLVPERWRERVKSAYLLGLLIIFIYLIGGQMDTTAYTVMVFVVMFLVGGALAVWWARRKAAPAAKPGGDEIENLADKVMALPEPERKELRAVAEEKLGQGSK